MNPCPHSRFNSLRLVFLLLGIGAAPLAIPLQAQMASGTVDSIVTLRSVSAITYHTVVVAGYSSPRDGGGGTYCYNPTSTEADNGGTVIVGTVSPYPRWILTQPEPPSIQQFGAVNGMTADNSVAINAALATAGAVRVPPGSYRCDNPILLDNGEALIGIGSHGAADGSTTSSAPQLVFFGSGDACIYSLAVSNLVDASLDNLAITVDPSASYTWIMHFTETVSVNLSNIRAATTSLTTGGIRSNIRTSCPGSTWVNHWYNVQVSLPAYAGSGSPPAATMPALDVDMSDSHLMGCSFVGGTGAVFRGKGVLNCTNVNFSGSVGYAVTLEENLPGESLDRGFVNCTFANPVSGVAMMTLDQGGGTTSPINAAVRFVGSTFSTPGVTTPLFVQNNTTGTAVSLGGTLLNNTFLSNPSAVFSLPDGGGVTTTGTGWTLAYNKYQNAPDFSSLTSATITEDNDVVHPAAAVDNGPTVLAQSGVAVAYTGMTAETALATIPIAGGLLGTNGKLRISATFAVTGTHSKTARVRYGSGLSGVLFYLGTVSGSTTLIHTECEIGLHSANAEVTAHGQIDTGPGITNDALANGTANTANNLSVTLTGSRTNTSDSITLEQYTVEVIQP